MMMNTQTMMAIALLALGLVLVVSLPISMISNQAFAGGPKDEKNFGQCKQDFPDKPCKNFHTGG
jgi:hypothetical protein